MHESPESKWDVPKIIFVTQLYTQEINRLLVRHGLTEFSMLSNSQLYEAYIGIGRYRLDRDPIFMDFDLSPCTSARYPRRENIRPRMGFVAHKIPRDRRLGELLCFSDASKIAEVFAGTFEIIKPIYRQLPRAGGVIVNTIDLFYSDKYLLTAN